MARTYRLHRSPFAKTDRYPLRRCSLDAAFEVAETTVVKTFRFHSWRGQPLLDAIFQGKGRHSPLAGACELSVNAVPVRDAKVIEGLLLAEGLPRFLAWLRFASRAADEHPTDIFCWSVQLVPCTLVYTQYPHAP